MFFFFIFLDFMQLELSHNFPLKTNIVSNTKLHCRFHLKNLFVIFFIIIVAADSEVTQFIAIFVVSYNTDPVTKAVLFEIPFCQVFQISFWEMNVWVDDHLHLLPFQSNIVAQIVNFAVHFDVFLQVFFLFGIVEKRDLISHRSLKFIMNL